MKLSLAALVVIFFAAPVWADSITEYATGSEIGSVTSSGTAGGYYVANGGEFAVSPVDAIAEFSLAGLSDTTITSATLELWTSAVTDNVNDIAIYGFAGNGVVSSADYEQGTLVENAGNFSYTDTGDEYTINVAGIVQSLASSGDSYIGFDIRDVEAVNGNSANLSDVISPIIIIRPISSNCPRWRSITPPVPHPPRHLFRLQMKQVESCSPQSGALDCSIAVVGTGLRDCFAFPGTTIM